MKRQQQPVEPAPPKERTYLVRWKCRECPRTQGGYIGEFDHQPRICRGIPATGAKSEGDTCGGFMDIVHDDRPGR